MMEEGAAAGPLVDCHAHVWGPGMPFAKDAWKRPDYTYTVEEFLADLDAHGVRYGVIAAASLFGSNNDYSLQALRAHSRLRATAIVDDDVDLATLKTLRAAGMVGLRLQWFFRTEVPDLDAGRWPELCRWLRDLDMHLQLNIRGEHLARVGGQLQHAGVKLVVDHFGWHDPAPRLAAPSYQDMLRLVDGGGVWVKMSSAYRDPEEHFPDWSLMVEYAQDLLRRFGVDKLLWGSDAPFVGHEHVASYGLAIERWRQCVPDAATRRALGINCHRFYFTG